MWRGKPATSDELRQISIDLEDAGYTSVLLTFHSESPDYFIKSAAALIPGHNLKYMIALRPYHISSQYCAMMVEGFNQIEPNRLIFNWIAGDYQNRPEEKPQTDVYQDSSSIDTIEKRKIFLRNFVSELKSCSLISSMPDMIFSGYSDYTIETANIFDSATLCMLDDYRKHKDILSINKKIFVAFSVVIIDDETERSQIENILINYQDRLLDCTFVGTEDDIINKILNLESEGITDVLISSSNPALFETDLYDEEKNYLRVNSLTKKIIKGA